MSDPLMQRQHEPPPAWSLFAPATIAPALARRTDPRTSHAAAESLDCRRQLDILAAVFQDAGAAGLTAEEAGDIVAFTGAGAWKRVSDLLRLGVIVDSGTTRVARSGRAQRVLVIAGDA